jgi:putative hydrolase of the HAD superfamily
VGEHAEDEDVRVEAEGREVVVEVGDPQAGAGEDRTPDARAVAGNGAISGLLVDWGGVMTTNVFHSFRAFCEAEGLDPAALTQAFRGNEAARELLVGFEEGRVAEADFESQLGGLLGLKPGDRRLRRWPIRGYERSECLPNRSPSRPASPPGLIDRLFAGTTLEESMVAAVRAARAAGIATGLISNSWGTTRYPRELLGELFDGVVISGEVGIRKPAPRIYELGAETIGHEPARCVFVDDLPFNLPPAVELGMATVHHTAPDTTIAELERLLGVALHQASD